MSAAAPKLASAPRPPQDLAVAAFSQLLKAEADARSASSERELRYLIVNETLSLVRARQIFVLSRGATRKFQVEAVSSLALVDRNVPLIEWIERIAARLEKDVSATRHHIFTLPAYCGKTDSITSEYPFPNMMWLPLWSREGRTSSAVLIARDSAWTEADTRIALRLAQTYGHALELLRSPKPFLKRQWKPSRLMLLSALALVVLGFFPVRMSVLAPTEVVPREPAVVAMPVEGIVEKVLVNPNETIKAGQPVVQLADTLQRSKFEVAVRDVAVAEARLEQASALAFSDARGRHELGIAQAELALSIARRNFAKDVLDQFTIIAPSAGLAIFPDKKDLEGRPLTAGAQLMQIATPGQAELQINLPVADSIVLQTGNDVRAYLDSDPLNAYDATVAHANYQATISDTQVAIHRVTARADRATEKILTLGTRGTAQIYGQDTTLAMYLFRRPLSALRQWIGL